MIDRVRSSCPTHLSSSILGTPNVVTSPFPQRGYAYLSPYGSLVFEMHLPAVSLAILQIMKISPLRGVSRPARLCAELHTSSPAELAEQGGRGPKDAAGSLPGCRWDSRDWAA